MYLYAYPVFTQRTSIWTNIKGVRTNKYIDYDFELKKCTRDRFFSEKGAAEIIKLYDDYYCPQNFSFSVTGNFVSNTKKSLYISVRKCDQTYLNKYYPGQMCKNDTEIAKALENLQVNLPIMTSYFDEEEYLENPIKH